MRSRQHESRRKDERAGERGGARFNFIAVALVIALVGYSTYSYAPVAYNAYLFRDFMQDTVNKAAYPPGQNNEWITSQLRAAVREFNLPPDTIINVQKENGRIAARAQWSRPVQLPGFVYEYRFDHTAQSSGFINPQY